MGENQCGIVVEEFTCIDRTRSMPHGTYDNTELSPSLIPTPIGVVQTFPKFKFRRFEDGSRAALRVKTPVVNRFAAA